MAANNNGSLGEAGLTSDDEDKPSSLDLLSPQKPTQPLGPEYLSEDEDEEEEEDPLLSPNLDMAALKKQTFFEEDEASSEPTEGKIPGYGKFAAFLQDDEENADDSLDEKENESRPLDDREVHSPMRGPGESTMTSLEPEEDSKPVHFQKVNVLSEEPDLLSNQVPLEIQDAHHVSDNSTSQNRPEDRFLTDDSQISTNVDDDNDDVTDSSPGEAAWEAETRDRMTTSCDHEQEEKKEEKNQNDVTQYHTSANTSISDQNNAEQALESKLAQSINNPSTCKASIASSSPGSDSSQNLFGREEPALTECIQQGDALLHRLHVVQEKQNSPEGSEEFPVITSKLASLLDHREARERENSLTRTDILDFIGDNKVEEEGGSGSDEDVGTPMGFKPSLQESRTILQQQKGDDEDKRHEDRHVQGHHGDDVDDDGDDEHEDRHVRGYHIDDGSGHGDDRHGDTNVRGQYGVDGDDDEDYGHVTICNVDDGGGHGDDRHGDRNVMDHYGGDRGGDRDDQSNSDVSADFVPPSGLHEAQLNTLTSLPVATIALGCAGDYDDDDADDGEDGDDPAANSRGVDDIEVDDGVERPVASTSLQGAQKEQSREEGSSVGVVGEPIGDLSQDSQLTQKTLIAQDISLTRETLPLENTGPTQSHSTHEQNLPAERHEDQYGQQKKPKQAPGQNQELEPVQESAVTRKQQVRLSKEEELVRMGKMIGEYSEGSVRKFRERKLLFEAFQQAKPDEVKPPLHRPTRPLSSSISAFSLSSISTRQPSRERIQPSVSVMERARSLEQLTQLQDSNAPWQRDRDRGPSRSWTSQPDLEDRDRIIVEGDVTLVRRRPSLRPSRSSEALYPRTMDEMSDEEERGEAEGVVEDEDEEDSAVLHKKNPFFKLRPSLALRPDVARDIRDGRERERELRKLRRGLYGSWKKRRNSHGSGNPQSQQTDSDLLSRGKLDRVWPPPSPEKPTQEPQPLMSPSQKTLLWKRWESGTVNGYPEELTVEDQGIGAAEA